MENEQSRGATGSCLRSALEPSSVANLGGGGDGAAVDERDQAKRDSTTSTENGVCSCLTGLLHWLDCLEQQEFKHGACGDDNLALWAHENRHGDRDNYRVCFVVPT
ncbi:hypothetical protein Q3G72_010704 [Acer saccharum]|nr:hypothetical protein Q3G72_010704 [Acer saccharum]